ncbi:spore germination protein [Paenibacillus sp. 8b26]
MRNLSYPTSVTGLFIALIAPSFFFAISTFHQEMLPTNQLICLAVHR